MWKAKFDELQERTKQLVAEREKKIAEQRAKLGSLAATMSDLRATIQEGFDSNPNLNTQEWINAQHLEEAQANRDQAYLLRDYAMRTLLAVDLIHHPTDGNADMCSCGKPVRDCLVGKALESEREYLYGWERRQVERARKGHRDFLPESHPDHYLRVPAS